MARESRTPYGDPTQQVAQQTQQAAQQTQQTALAQPVAADSDPAQAGLVNQIVGMVLQRVNAQAGQGQQPAIEASALVALARAVLAPTPLSTEVQAAIDKYIALSSALAKS